MRIKIIFENFEASDTLKNIKQKFKLTAIDISRYRYPRKISKKFGKRRKSGQKIYQLQWGWGITGQRITGQSCPDWLEMTSPRTSKSNSGDLSRF